MYRKQHKLKIIGEWADEWTIVEVRSFFSFAKENLLYIPEEIESLLGLQDSILKRLVCETQDMSPERRVHHLQEKCLSNEVIAAVLTEQHITKRAVFDLLFPAEALSPQGERKRIQQLVEKGRAQLATKK